MKSMYDKRPTVKTEGWCADSWSRIIEELSEKMCYQKMLVIDCYAGVYYEALKEKLREIQSDIFIDTASLLKTEEEILKMTERLLTDDVLFGYITPLNIADYFDEEKLALARKVIAEENRKIIVFGYGAAYVSNKGVIVYADMPRWEIQQRMRRKEVNGLGVQNCNEYISIQYKRGFFNDWKILDRHKQDCYNKIDYWLDTTDMSHPKMIDKETFFAGMDKAVSGPFRVVPFFDPAPWGGQWMKEVCNLDRSAINYGWCFDCVPEENSLILEVGGIEFEMPAINLVYTQSTALLGEKVEAEFGKEFPIRFDFLDTIDGGNLSLQVHPTKEFARNNFGIPYTQDESYYLVDVKEDACVYLGLKNGIDKKAMQEDLEKASKGNGFRFDADKYINKIPAKKHDHFLIPAGTIHCSGKNSVVLEISATPNLFTFKLWDWDRLGLDGKPRPVNVERGKAVIQWDRDTEYAQEELVNQFKIIAKGDGWIEEKTGLHNTQFIETRRHTFSMPVHHETKGSVNVLNLLEGEEIIVESIHGEFEPFIVHYAETFIVPASVGQYSIRPYGTSEGKECITIKAYVRCS